MSPKAQPTHSALYQDGMHAQKFKRDEIDEMLKVNANEPVQTKWVAQIIFTPKKGRFSSFPIDNQECNAVTVRESDPIPTMNK